VVNAILAAQTMTVPRESAPSGCPAIGVVALMKKYGRMN
jgi:hypothetical protein